MKVTVDFSDWVKRPVLLHSFIQGVPGGLFTVHLRMTESQSVCQALGKSYRKLHKVVRHHFLTNLGRDEVERKERTLSDQASEMLRETLDGINPFGHYAYEERIGFTWTVATAGREVHLVDRVGKLPEADGTISLVVSPRRFHDVERARSLDVLAGLFVDATGHRSSLTAATSYLREGGVLGSELERILGGVLQEPSTVAYVDLAAPFGIFWVEGMHVKSTYPSEIWRQVESLGDAALLADTATFHQRLTHLLEKIKMHDVQMSPTIKWWLTRQTFLLRHHMTVLLTYPETFHSAAAGENMKYDSIIQKFLKPDYVGIANWLEHSSHPSSGSVTSSSDDFCKNYLMSEYPNQPIDIGRVFRRIFHVPRVKNRIDNPNRFNKALNFLYDSSSLVAPTIAIFFKYFRNCIVHGHSFEPRWAKLGPRKVPAGLRFHKSDLVFTIGFDCLLVCWQLLPIVLTELSKATIQARGA